MTTPLPIGVVIRTIGADPDTWLESARRLDAAGYAGVWAWDHVMGPPPFNDRHARPPRGGRISERLTPKHPNRQPARSGARCGIEGRSVRPGVVGAFGVDFHGAALFGNTRHVR